MTVRSFIVTLEFRYSNHIIYDLRAVRFISTIFTLYAYLKMLVFLIFPNPLSQGSKKSKKDKAPNLSSTDLRRIEESMDFVRRQYELVSEGYSKKQKCRFGFIVILFLA